MGQKKRVKQSVNLMTEFAERTGLNSNGGPVRYLWTDAFAVCNFFGLADAAEKDEFRELAFQLIDQVHEILGRHRKDDPRSGWISGLSEEKGREHPTWGGLRIGKKLPERGPEDRFDQLLEWERDGQYFHYLTKWMHALDIAARETGEDRFAQWAVELAKAARKAFVYRETSGRIAMYWKMSIDLSRPLVPSMGQHDPLDGYITLQQLHATAQKMGGKLSGKSPAGELSLKEELDIFSQMVEGRDWGTPDPLGIGGLLMDAGRLVQLINREASRDTDLLTDLLRSAEAGIEYWKKSGSLNIPARQRLAFRELGLAIGLQGIQRKEELIAAGNPDYAEKLSAYFPLGEEIIEFWLNPENRRERSWREHEDINTVMLATALEPTGFLVLP